jgi:acyl-homoserine-lactone acylase
LLGLRFTIAAFAACCLAAAASPANADIWLGGRLVEAPHGEILWDQYGVPHIYGETVEDVLYGYGYAQMKNHAEVILRKVAAARGRLAEYFGPGDGDANAMSDRRARTFGVYPRAEAWLVEGTEEQRRFLALFCAGVQSYLDEHGSTVDPALKRVAPVTPADILAVIQFSIP